MKILYSPQRNESKIEYQFDGDIITATINEETDTFDFSSLRIGDKVTNIKTILCENPIMDVERKEDGELSVILKYNYGPEGLVDGINEIWHEV